MRAFPRAYPMMVASLQRMRVATLSWRANGFYQRQLALWVNAGDQPEHDLGDCDSSSCRMIL